VGSTALVSCLMRSFKEASSAVSMLNLGAIAGYAGYLEPQTKSDLAESTDSGWV